MRSCYIHIPFCEKICSYCDFCKLFYNKDIVDKYLVSLENEIKSLYNGEVLETIYIGGGTPSSLSLEQLQKLFSIVNLFNRSENVEFTIECNFSNIDENKLKLFKKFGVNRLSFGIETINVNHQKLLERYEEKNDIFNKIVLAKDLGFNNINVDLMYAFPHETIEELDEDLKFIKSLDVEHISCYSLIIENNTKLGIKKVENIDADLDFEMYDYICKFMKNNGFNHYEISNYSKDGYESRHNLVYWNNEFYYGFGLGASAYFENRRVSNTRSINKYLNGLYLFEEENLKREDLVYYEILLNLRKSSGIDLTKLWELYRVRIECGDIIELGMVEVCNNFLYIPEDKWYISNEIIIRVLDGVIYE